MKKVIKTILTVVICLFIGMIASSDTLEVQSCQFNPKCPGTSGASYVLCRNGCYKEICYICNKSGPEQHGYGCGCDYGHPKNWCGTCGARLCCGAGHNSCAHYTCGHTCLGHHQYHCATCHSAPCVCDQTPPVIHAVGSDTHWVKGPTREVNVYATDASGIGGYMFNGNGAWVGGSVQLPNGNHYVQAKDTRGNVSSATYFTVSGIDNNGPTVGGISYTPETFTKWSVFIVATSVADRESGLDAASVSYNGGADWLPITQPFELHGSVKSLPILIRDNVNNITRVDAAVTWIDRTAPILASAITFSHNTWTNQDVTLGINAVDKNYTIDTYEDISAVGLHDKPYSFDGVTWTDKLVLKDNYDANIYIRDKLLNVSMTAVKYSWIDKIKPTVFANSDGLEWKKTPVKISVAANDEYSGINSYSVDGVNFGTTEAHKTKTVTTNGTYKVYAKDNAGNIDYTEFTVSNIIDRELAFDIETDLPLTGWASKDVTVSVKNQSGYYGALVDLQYSFDDGSTWGSNSSIVVDANQTLKVQIKDDWGITTSRELVISNIDKNMPVIKSWSLDNNDWSNTEKIVTVKIETGTSGLKEIRFGEPSVCTLISKSDTEIKYRVSNEVFNIASLPLKITVVKNNGLELTATSTLPLKIDTEKPTISIVSKPDTWQPLKGKVVVQGLDPATSGTISSGLHELPYRVDGGAWQESPEFDLTEQGEHLFEVRDIAGNIGQLTERIDFIDSIVPNIVLIEDIKAGETYQSIADKVGIKITSQAFGNSGKPAKWFSISIPNRTDVGIGVYMTDEEMGAIRVDINGTYPVQIVNNAGTTYQTNWVVSHLDEWKPTIKSTVSVLSTDRLSSVITVVAEDKGMGVKRVGLTTSLNDPSLAIWNNGAKGAFTITENGVYYSIAEDRAGNFSVITGEQVNDSSINLDEIDDKIPDAPSIKLVNKGKEISGHIWVNDKVDVYLNGNGNLAGGFKQYELQHVELDTLVEPTDEQWANSTKRQYSTPNTLSESHMNTKKIAIRVRVQGNNTRYSNWSATAFILIDQVSPVIEPTGIPKPEEWVNSLWLKAIVTDNIGYSGIAESYLSVNGKRFTTNSTKIDCTLESGDYFFFALDNAGNQTKIDFTVKYDNEKPVLNHSITTAPDEQSADILVTAKDLGGSGLQTIVAPDGTATTESQLVYTVLEDGTYTFKAIDFAGNEQTLNVEVDVLNILKSSDISLVLWLETNSSPGIPSGIREGHDIKTTMSEIFLESTDVEGSGRFVVGNNRNCELVSVNGATSYSYKGENSPTLTDGFPFDYNMTNESEKVYVVVVRARNGTERSYHITLSSLGGKPQITIVNKEAVENSIYSSTGYHLNNTFTKYTALTNIPAGTSLEVKIKGMKSGQVIQGEVLVDGTACPINWGAYLDTSNGSQVAKPTTDTKGNETIGYINIPTNKFKADKNQVPLVITVWDVNGGKDNERTSSKETFKWTVDVTAPTIEHKIDSELLKVTLTAKDKNKIANIKYSLDNGVTWQDYTEQIQLEYEKVYVLKVRSADLAQNTSITETINIPAFVRPTAPVTTYKPLSVKYYTTQRAEYSLVNGNSSATNKNISGNSFKNFEFASNAARTK